MDIIKQIAEILEQPCDVCELEDNCDCQVRDIICPYQEKKAGQILAIEVEEDRVCKQCNGNGGYHGSFNSNSWETCYECGGLKIFPGRTLKQLIEEEH